MKKIFLGLFAIGLSTSLCAAQDFPIDSETKKITFTEVVEAPDASKDALYARAKAWFVTGTGETKTALELEDKEVGKLLGKVNNSVKANNPPLNNKFEVGSVIYTINIIVKDGKYKYTFTDFVHDSDRLPKVISCGPLENKKTAAKASAITQDMPTNYQWKKNKGGYV